jgi:hypothetical protein
MATSCLLKMNWGALLILLAFLTSASSVRADDSNSTNATTATTEPPDANTTNATTAPLPPTDTPPLIPVTTTLPLADVNFLVLTDVHGWVSHRGRHEPNRNVDFGDILSFHEQLQQQMENDQDLWFLLNGNFIHGGGVLGTQDPPRAMGGILEDMPFDLVTLGNHEAEETSMLEFVQEPGGLGDWWGPKMVTSNLLDNTTKASFGENYYYLHGKAATVLTFGFIADPTTSSSASLMSDLIQVQPVHETLDLPWFKEVLERDDFDMIVILASIPADDPLVHAILKKIRDICGKDMIVQFFTGQSHKRANVALDAKAVSTEAGANFDTLGFVSIDTMKGTSQHEFIEANNASFAKAVLGDEKQSYATVKGVELRGFIERSEKHAGGNEILGCSPQRYRAGGYLNETDSLLRLYLKHVMPKGLLNSYVGSDGQSEFKNVLLQSIQDFVWYDLFAGVITMNDLLAIVPHDDTILKVAHSLQGDKINRLKSALAEKVTVLNGTASSYEFAVSGEVEHGVGYEFFVLTSEAPLIREHLDGMRVRHPVNELVSDGQKTVRDVWVDFIKKEWPYDGKDCTTPHEYSDDEDSEDAEEEDPVEETAPKVDKKSFKDVEPQPNNSSVGAIIGLSFAIAAVLLVVAQLSGRRPHGSIGITRVDGVELQPMPSSYRDEPNSYQGPPASTFRDSSLMV